MMRRSTSPFRLHRRTMLRGAGVGVALPLLEAMLGRHGRLAMGAAEPQPIRLVTVMFTWGTHPAVWLPTTQGRDFALPLGLAPLSARRADINVLSGLHQRVVRGQGISAHGFGLVGALTSTPNIPGRQAATGPSIDQAVAKQIAQRSRTLLPSAVVALGGGSPSSWIASGQPAPVLRGPAELFEALFPGGKSPSGPNGFKDKQAHERRLLDVIRGDSVRLKARLGASDRARVDQHLTAIEELERQIALHERHAQTCATPAAPAAGGSKAEQLRMVARLVQMAFRCDTTRVITILVGPYDQIAKSPTDPSLISDHDASHGNAEIMGRSTVAKITQFAYLLEQLASAPEGDSNLLRQSLVLTGNDVSHGNRHDYDDMPVLLAGSAGGQVRTGLHIRYRDQPIGRLYVSLMNIFGGAQSQFGVDGFGELPGILA
jgi:hypothetical protein